MIMHTNVDNIRGILVKARISPTPVRILVYRCLVSSSRPLSLSDLETDLESVDKSTISRTLSTFRKNNLIHAFNDGSGSTKYELCHCLGLKHNDMHVHFHCRKCGSTICLNDIAIPLVSLPEGFQVSEINYVATGVCSKCGRHP